MKRKNKAYWTIVYDEKKEGFSPLVSVLESLPVFAGFLFETKHEAMEAAMFHKEHWDIDCHAVLLKLPK